jgi:hypothetical protein
MALFTDGPISCIEDLTAQDSQLLNVASVEGIDTTRKMELAKDDLALDLLTALARLRNNNQQLGMPAPIKLDTVADTPPLRLWHTTHSLELVYADAYFDQLNDRYAKKRDQFHDLAKWAYSKLTEIGLGIVTTPVRRANTPTVTAFPGNLPDNLYYVTMTWVNRAGEEGAPADAATIATTNSTLLVEPGPAAANATGWNVYAGITHQTMYRQNATVVDSGQTWQQPGTLVQSGSFPGHGQKPNYLLPLPRVFQRG